MGPRSRRVGLVVGVVGVCAFALCGVLFWNWWHQELNAPYKGYLEAKRIVVIQRGSSVQEIGDSLEKAGIIKSAFLFRASVRNLGEPILQAGEYEFSSPLSIAEVVQRLRVGDVHKIRVTIPEGSDLVKVAVLLCDSGLCSISGFFDAVRDTTLIAHLDPEARDLEGYLMPDTYVLTHGIPDHKIVETMVDNTLEFWTPDRLARAHELGFSVRQVVTLASLIEKETGNARERPLISAVFHNRLRLGMNLMCDPTVIYGVRLVKEYDGVINQSDLALDSPYNTYRYPGLPPGPITNPGRASLEAALHPARSDYLYFVSRNDGTHVFSTNYRSHENAVRRYQR
ncbi:MAG: endolytic transglycosylase MltG [Acidobacteriota bacterium]